MPSAWFHLGIICTLLKADFDAWVVDVDSGMYYNIKKFMKIFIPLGSLAGVIALMLMAIIFEGLSMIVKVAGVLMEKKLDAGAAFLQLLASKNFNVTCGTALSNFETI